MSQVRYTTFRRQAANLCIVKERILYLIRDELLPYDPSTAVLDDFPISVCQFARACRSRRFRDMASYGKDHTSRQTFYGFRLHVRQAWQGNITHMFLAEANVHEGEVAFDLTAGTHGVLLEDHNSWLPSLKEALRSSGVLLLTLYRNTKHQPLHSWSPMLGRVRSRIDPLFGQLVERGGAKHV